MASAVLDVSLISQSFMANPYPTLSRLRHAGPLVRVKLPFVGKTWMVTNYDVVTHVLRDDRTFVRDARNAGKKTMAGLPWWFPGILRVLGENMLSHDDPDHRRLRKLVDQAFSRHGVEQMRPSIARICDSLLPNELHHGPMDLIKRFARPLPLAVICELLGLPLADRAKFTQWAQAVMSITSLLGIVSLFRFAYRMVAYFRQHFEQCRHHPRPGLMTALVQAEQDGDKLSEKELVGMAFLLLLAGHETTVHLISGGVRALLGNPEQKALLLADGSLVSSAVEELLRYVSPVQIAKPRYLSNDLEFHGQKLRRGEMLIPMLAAANADPDRFENPEHMDITRSPNSHVAFGTGAHFCLGAQLARVEAQVAFEKLFTRFPNLTLAVPPSTLKYTGRLGMRALTALPVRLT